MSFVLRTIGWILILLAVAALGADLLNWLQSGSFAFHEFGARWFQLHSESLNASQAGVQRHLWPGLWDAIRWVLLQPAVLVFGVPGIVLALLFSRRHRLG